ncbi:uncharacterized protein AtWU_01412 [Aspergillus tubingensis]|uniref:uncharacterized protein n=1 Tax=Aspergillus tubingensis TaxID=5068 RepID=UPI0015778E06|nr:uncharacterized protein AtWU_01412 [Aspergillus tubingensis]GFN11615.1 hypothetical protein AtWU_01412 [Aspergillus tubingensis]
MEPFVTYSNSIVKPIQCRRKQFSLRRDGMSDSWLGIVYPDKEFQDREYSSVWCVDSGSVVPGFLYRQFSSPNDDGHHANDPQDCVGLLRFRPSG